MITFLSQSSLSQFMRCQVQWEYRWVKDIIIPPGIAARRGSSVHKAAAHNYIQKKTTLEDEPLSVLQDVARDEYVHLVKDEGVFIPQSQLSDKVSLLNDGLNAALSLTKLFREDLAPLIEPDLVEERLEVDVGLEVPVCGTLDLTTSDGSLRDLKTADKSKNQSEADTSLQLSLYAGLYKKRVGKWPKHLSLDVLVNTKVPKLQSLETTRGERNWKDIVSRLEIMVAQIKTGVFAPTDPGNWACSEKWCGFWNICKWGKNR